MRTFLICFAFALIGCDHAMLFNMSLAPQPVALPPASGDSVFRLVARIAARQNFMTADGNTLGVYECYYRGNVTLCVKAADGRIDFRMVEFLRGQWSSYASTVRRELTDSLRASFGEAAVRDCKPSLG
ncbi:MAG TPA: hypothetical protein VJN70_09965, partial [Gemmatimonadaceae bacterium]|nr:hypothetical protein [Gemmatimonadaceae bacterium]